MDFGVGDVVKLPEGAQMTVEKVDQLGSHVLVKCVWFEETELHRETFTSSDLTSA